MTVRCSLGLAGFGLCLLLVGACSSSEAGTHGSAATSSAGSFGGTGSVSGSAGAGGDAGAGGSVAYSEVGVCGRRGQALVDTSQGFQGTEEFFIIGEEGFGDEVCRVRFDVEHAGDAPPGCDAAAGPQNSCSWTHLVRYKNPVIEVDSDDSCANSEYGLDAPGIADIDGSQVAYGFVSEYQGHLSVLLEFDGTSALWLPVGNANWDPVSLEFYFDRREGYCGYGL